MFFCNLGQCCFNLASLAGWEKAEVYFKRGRYFIRQLQSQKGRLTNPEHIKMADKLMCCIQGCLGPLYANLRDFDKAEECGIEALEIARNVFGLAKDERERYDGY